MIYGILEGTHRTSNNENYLKVYLSTFFMSLSSHLCPFLGLIQWAGILQFAAMVTIQNILHVLWRVTLSPQQPRTGPILTFFIQWIKRGAQSRCRFPSFLSQEATSGGEVFVDLWFDTARGNRQRTLCEAWKEKREAYNIITYTSQWQTVIN